VFDIEPYNYIFNKRSCFLDDDFVQNDYNQLSRVLSNFEKIEPDYLDLLNYTNKVKNKEYDYTSALSRAIEDHNYKCIDLILNYMAKTSQNCCGKYTNHLSVLCSYKSFFNYLGSHSFRTLNLEEK